MAAQAGQRSGDEAEEASPFFTERAFAAPSPPPTPPRPAPAAPSGPRALAGRCASRRAEELGDAAQLPQSQPAATMLHARSRLQSEGSEATFAGWGDIYHGNSPFLPRLTADNEKSFEDDCGLFADMALDTGDLPERSDVILHIYHCDGLTGFLNKAVLLNAEIPIYHVGVEVYGREWAFQYFEDTWDDPTVSGVHSCTPMCAPGYEFVRSVSLGPTPLTEAEVVSRISRLRQEWPACSYHITRRNCVNFAELCVTRLEAPVPFPTWLSGILDASRHAAVDTLMDYSWTWTKWWMAKKPGTPRPQLREAADAAARGSASCFNLFSLMEYSACATPIKAAQ